MISRRLLMCMTWLLLRSSFIKTMPWWRTV